MRVCQVKEWNSFMSVDGVNNSSNTGLYCASGAVLGVAGYLCGGIGTNKETPETPKKVDAQA